MKIKDAITILLSGLYEPDAAKRPSAEAQHEARACIVASRDAWEVFAELFEMVNGKEPANRELVDRLFGCDQALAGIEDHAGTSGDELRRSAPQIAIHLDHCRRCHDLYAAAAQFADGLTSTTAADQAPAWRSAVDTLQRTVYELAEAVTYGLRDGLPQIMSFPTGMIPATASAVRSDDPAATSDEPRFDRLTFLLPGVESPVMIRINSTDEADRVDILVEFGTPLGTSCSLELSEPGRQDCIAAELVTGTTPVLFSSIPLGNYLLRFEFISRREVATCRLDLAT